MELKRFTKYIKKDDEDFWVLDSWKNHFKEKGIYTQIKCRRGPYALYVNSELIINVARIIEYCDRHRTENKCQDNCRYLRIGLFDKNICTIKERL